MRINVFIKPLFLVEILFFISCNSNNHNTISEKDEIISFIDEKPIYSSEIDSLASDEIYKIKKQYLYKLLSERLLEMEAKSRNLSLEELMKKEIVEKTQPANLIDYENFKRQNPHISALTKEDILQIKQIIETEKFKERKEIYLNSLMNKYNVEIILNNPITGLHRITDICPYYKGNKYAPIILYVISDYDCLLCKKVISKIDNILLENKGKLKVFYIHYSNVVTLGSLALVAAGKQGKYWEMHQILYSEKYIEEDMLHFLKIAKKLNLNIDEFKKDIKNDSIKNKILDNYSFLEKKNIYAVPRFVLNDVLLPDTIKIDQLENYINDNINSYKNEKN